MSFLLLRSAEALAAALDECPDSIQESLSTLFSLYIRDAGLTKENVDTGWLGRQGVALALHSSADVLGTIDVPVVMTFLISRALADPNADVRGRMINAGIMIIDKHGRDNVSLLFPIFENYLNKKDDEPALVSRLLNELMKSDKYGEHRGAAFGLAGVVKGFGISCLKKYGIVAQLQEGLVDRYVIKMLPLLLVSFSDQVVAVREGAECAARAVMSQLSAQGVKLVLPSLLKGLEDKAWRTKQSSVQLLGAMAYCAPQPLSQCLPKIVPKLTEVLKDTHPKVL
ncbi:protein ILITYHIA-like isoform X2 [Pyrus x bretschneideri]|nr:protein ILITYHIA-like isoform X2 [Pyrus x bretschneideri]